MSTVLDTYLKSEGINDADFAPRIGRDRTTVSRLRRGIIRPTIDLAHEIEKVTDGAVPLRSWIEPGEPGAAAEQAAA